MRKEEKYPEQKCLNISYLQTDYLNLDNNVSGSSINNERAHSVQTKCTFCGLNNHSAEIFFERIRQEKEEARAAGISSNRNSERPLLRRHNYVVLSDGNVRTVMRTQ